MSELARRAVQHAMEDAQSIAHVLRFAHEYALVARTEGFLDGDRDLASFEASLVRYPQLFEQKMGPQLQKLLDATLKSNLGRRAEEDEAYRRAYAETYMPKAKEVALNTLREICGA
ncbi:hypothetical protein [Ktedonospora formicarum]|uniref:Uncharacterized protein n=1 Tax=Ktedonospora formicarum TaxID=2778364 RepID=A0A8J3I927_9CHLR|nr:hypothetical protein [Ktedonospora formicarum]GHO48262.1 hypothetical protein KSX_64250 [Ktedonospora formicarum]